MHSVLRSDFIAFIFWLHFQGVLEVDAIFSSFLSEGDTAKTKFKAVHKNPPYASAAAASSSSIACSLFFL